MLEIINKPLKQPRSSFKYSKGWRAGGERGTKMGPGFLNPGGENSN